jgi:hypothetical protein
METEIAQIAQIGITLLRLDLIPRQYPWQRAIAHVLLKKPGLVARATKKVTAVD